MWLHYFQVACSEKNTNLKAKDDYPYDSTDKFFDISDYAWGPMLQQTDKATVISNPRGLYNTSAADFTKLYATVNSVNSASAQFYCISYSKTVRKWTYAVALSSVIIGC
jgi:hypothetical protein